VQSEVNIVHFLNQRGLSLCSYEENYALKIPVTIEGQLKSICSVCSMIAEKVNGADRSK
jgi:hypothetical protein